MPGIKDSDIQSQIIISQLKNGNTDALKSIFDLFSEKLFYHALKFVYSTEVAEEVVQDVFIAIWEKREALDIQHSLESYLYNSVRNRAISYLRKKVAAVEMQDLSHAENISESSANEISVEFKELNNTVQEVINSLPERCKLIFNLSRNSGLTYKQIAEELNISPESVKTQIGIALKKLKVHLKQFGEL